MDAGSPSTRIHYNPALNTIRTTGSEGKALLPLPPHFNKCLMQISKFPANFPWKGRAGLWSAARSGVPGGVTPAAAASWLQVSFGLAGPGRCQKLALSPVSGCWFYLSSVSWICKKNSWFWGFFSLLAVVCKRLNVQKPIYLCQGGREMEKNLQKQEKKKEKNQNKKQQKTRRKEKERERKKILSRYCWAGRFLLGPVPLLEHVIVRQRSTSFTSFFHYSK